MQYWQPTSGLKNSFCFQCAQQKRSNNPINLINFTFNPQQTLQNFLAPSRTLCPKGPYHRRVPFTAPRSSPMHHHFNRAVVAVISPPIVFVHSRAQSVLLTTASHTSIENVSSNQDRNVISRGAAPSTRTRERDHGAKVFTNVHQRNPHLAPPRWCWWENVSHSEKPWKTCPDQVDDGGGIQMGSICGGVCWRHVKITARGICKEEVLGKLLFNKNIVKKV